MEILAVSKFIRTSPKKIRYLAQEVKKLKINEALNVLDFSTKRGAVYIKSTLESAIANAKNNNKIDRENLYIKKIDVTCGTAFKRQRAVARGMSHAYKKRTSHIRVVLETIKTTVKNDNKKGDK